MDRIETGAARTRADLTATRRVITFSIGGICIHGHLRKAAFILPVAVLFLALGSSESETSQKTFLPHPTIRIGMDANNPIPSCFANIGWVAVASNGTVDWTASAGRSQHLSGCVSLQSLIPWSTVVVMP